MVVTHSLGDLSLSLFGMQNPGAAESVAALFPSLHPCQHWVKGQNQILFLHPKQLQKPVSFS